MKGDVGAKRKINIERKRETDKRKNRQIE